MFGIGKYRTPVGRHLDEHGYTQEEFRKSVKIDKTTASKMCRDKDYIPGTVISRKVIAFIKKDNPNARIEDYFDI
ncbi:transcriptional regulator [Bacillus sp. Marseille-P3800]|uniref:transcriptional regulator n=1 Tax=Bacillus sp. Marseille-P3800 TaxID=2014782 RepID=UPI000C07ECBA|nr:transcriptional regulator [Bacillus sp. Marseille-P3800]